jgi:lipopolysaccharide/colanic/teichoic acid biosynthesis glycosyltransferase
MNSASHRITVLYVSASLAEAEQFRQQFADALDVRPASSPAQVLEACTQQPAPFAAILNAADPASALGLRLMRVLKQELQISQPILWLTNSAITPALRTLLLEVGGNDIFAQASDHERLLTRLYFLARTRSETSSAPSPYELRMPLGKRIMDVVCAGGALLLLSPFFLLIAALIKLESRGPVFYYSYRVGSGYRVFKFWKLRSMRSDADKLLGSVKSLNQYQNASSGKELTAPLGLCAACEAGGKCQQQLVDERGQFICEQQYRWQQKAAEAPAFIKIANDPRVTRIGRFIRNTSIDELPQLYNVLRGDMSLVGNRPLPLYEAEKLLTDEFSQRFIAPAGITGLWQVVRRGKGGDMSEEERKALDNEYAREFSLKKDIEIILKTIPALFQKENV